jgi:hypothetical protein
MRCVQADRSSPKRQATDCKPVSVPLRAIAIRLDRTLLPGSSNLPGSLKRSGPLLLPYLVLLRVGFALPSGLPRTRCALTAPFHPYLCSAGLGPKRRRFVFCGTFRENPFERSPPAVSRHAALWRPDFPLAFRLDIKSGTSGYPSVACQSQSLTECSTMNADDRCGV